MTSILSWTTHWLTHEPSAVRVVNQKALEGSAGVLHSARDPPHLMLSPSSGPLDLPWPGCCSVSGEAVAGWGPFLWSDHPPGSSFSCENHVFRTVIFFMFRCTRRMCFRTIVVGVGWWAFSFTFLTIVFIFFLLGLLGVNCYQEEPGNVLLLILHIRNEEYFMFMNKLLLFDVLITDKMFLFLFVTHEIAANGIRSTIHDVLEWYGLYYTRCRHSGEESIGDVLECIITW